MLILFILNFQTDSVFVRTQIKSSDDYVYRSFSAKNLFRKLKTRLVEIKSRNPFRMTHATHCVLKGLPIGLDVTHTHTHKHVFLKTYSCCERFGARHFMVP